MHLVSLEFWYNDQSHLWFKSRMALSLHNLPNGDDVLTSHQSKNQWTSTWNNKKSSITVPLSWPLRLKISRKLIIFNSFSYELICPLQEQLGEASSLFSSVDHFTHSFQNLDSPWISSWLLFLSSLSVHINLVRYFPYFDPAWLGEPVMKDKEREWKNRRISRSELPLFCGTRICKFFSDPKGNL